MTDPCDVNLAYKQLSIHDTPCVHNISQSVKFGYMVTIDRISDISTFGDHDKFCRSQRDSVCQNIAFYTLCQVYNSPVALNIYGESWTCINFW